LQGRYAWHSSHGVVEGIELQATRRVLMQDSIVRSVHSGDRSFAIEVGGVGTGTLADLTPYKVTAIVGEDWGDSLPTPTS
jgi:hypothetical protein